ncbi:MAG: DciA family protein [Pseudomonadota bacterium]
MTEQPINTRPARRHFKPLGDAALTVLSDMSVKCGAMDPSLRVKWKDIVEPQLAEISLPIRLKRRGKAMSLEVIALYSGVATKLYYQQKAILSRVAQVLGHSRVREITFKHYYSKTAIGRGRTGGKVWKSQKHTKQTAQPLPLAEAKARSAREALERLRSSVHHPLS